MLECNSDVINSPYYGTKGYEMKNLSRYCIQKRGKRVYIRFVAKMHRYEKALKAAGH